MPIAGEISTLTQYLVDKLEANKADLGIVEVFYGDQELVGKTPSVAVESGPLSRELTSTGMQSTDTYLNYFLVYHGKLQDTQLTRKECDEMAEAIMNLLHQDRNMGGHVVSSYVTSIEPGYARRGGIPMRASRITHESMTKARI